MPYPHHRSPCKCCETKKVLAQLAVGHWGWGSKVYKKDGVDGLPIPKSSK